MRIITNLHYERGAEIGRGNFGIVYLADDPQLGGIVAVKEIPKSNFTNAAEFFQEAKAMFASECPNVLPIRYASATSTHVCFAMPYMRNASLEKRIAFNPLSIQDVIRVGQGMLNGLTRIHLANLIHFDVKPSNILFSDSGEAMVGDFGQTRAIAASGVALLPDIYTVTMPPEAVAGFVGSVVCDIYQAGLTLYRAVNGEPHWQSIVPLPSLAADLILRRK